jgi:hypothetical protein
VTTTISGKKVATTASGHNHLGPPAMSNIPPMTPATPVGAPAPFVYKGETSNASDTSDKLVIGGGDTVISDSTLSIDPPGNQPSQPAPIHDVVTLLVNATILVD